MICPHCLNKVEDGATFCPTCNAYLGGGPAHADAVFCEGCGARIAAQMRTCPKCGRPAPGILSTDSASSDLAAGHTASFPRLTQRMIDADAAPRSSAPTAAQVLSDSMDPASTNVLSSDDIEHASRSSRSDADDPYHKSRPRFVKPVLVVVVALLVIGGGVFFVVRDPFGVMPGIVESFERAASEMYPSRQLPQGSSADEAAEPEPVEVDPFQVLTSSHNILVSAFESLDTIIEDYEYGFLANDRAQRDEKSKSAYGARDLVDSVVRDLDGLDLPEGSPYAQDVANLKQLAGWVRTRIDVYCASWDISLGIPEGERPSDHSDEILAPLRERSQEDQEARTQYFANVDSFKPVRKSS